MKSLQVFQRGDAASTPLYGVHLLGHGGHFYTPLAQALGPGISVYGIGGGDFGDTPEAEEARVDACAEGYATSILAHTKLPRIALGAFSMAVR